VPVSGVFPETGTGAGGIRRRQPLRHLQPRKGGPGITKSDIAEYLHASPDFIERGFKIMRGEWPFVCANLYDGVGLDTIISFILERGMPPERRPEKLAETA
jgi:urease accessory protein